ncbi:hypothetical protein GCM10008932_12880 [Alkalibacterium iburiense]|uniref:Uncharacterized protein n=1 Tax=Alkalibacterium iburiense TaxID=290589 RepID=A0ABN0XDT7_9LACT
MKSDNRLHKIFRVLIVSILVFLAGRGLFIAVVIENILISLGIIAITFIVFTFIKVFYNSVKKDSSNS